MNTVKNLLDWGRYESVIDNKPCIIGVNLTLMPPGALNEHPYLGRIILTCREEKHSNPIQHLTEISLRKSQFMKALDEFPSVFSGYIITRRDAELLFYSKQRIRWFSILRIFQQQNWKNWYLKMGQVIDVNAEVYHELVKPGTADRNDIRYFNNPF